jgi:hypothetical protein
MMSYKILADVADQQTRTAARFVFAVFGCVTVVCLSSVSCIAEVPAVPGAGCWNSETKLQDNLPLGTTATSTEVTNIFGIANGSQVLGWYYETRRGEHFIQSRNGHLDEFARLLKVAGAPRLSSGVLSNRPRSYISVEASTAKSLQRYLRANNAFAPCFSGPLTYDLKLQRIAASTRSKESSP